MVVQMLERAGNKRKLEALVIGSGKYTASAEDLQDIFTGKTGGGGSTSAAGLAASMFADEMRDLGARQKGGSTGAAAADKEIRVIQEGEDVISTEQLMLLLDRSDEAMKRGRGWKAETDTSSKAFEVIETVAAEPGEDDGDEVSSPLLLGLYD
jgi:ATP-dependent DNA helicase